jgi:hypothetical protein
MHHEAMMRRLRAGGGMFDGFLAAACEFFARP